MSSFEFQSQDSSNGSDIYWK